MNGDVIEPRIYFYYFAKWLCYLSFGQGGSFLKWVAANEITGQSAENGTSILTLLPPSFRKQSRREDGEGIRAGGWGDKLRVLCSGHGMAIAVMDSQKLWLPTQYQVSKNLSIDELQAPPLLEELLAAHRFWRERIILLCSVVSFPWNMDLVGYQIGEGEKVEKA